MRTVLFFFTILLFSVSAWAQEVVVQGRVVDAKTGEALPYVSIYAGEGKGTLSNNDGAFKLTADANDLLRFSCIGYEKMTAKATELPSVIRLKPYTTVLGEVTIHALRNEDMLKLVIANLKQDYKKQGKMARKYFFRTMTETDEGSYMAEAFVMAHSVVNIRSAMMISGLQNRDTEDNGKTLDFNFSNIHKLLEVAPMTNNSQFWSKVLKPLQSYSTLRKYYETHIQQIQGEDGKNLYRIDFSLKKEISKEIESKRNITGTAYVDADTYRLLRYDGSCNNFHVSYNMFTPYETAISFHLEYDYSQGVASVSHVAIQGSTEVSRYRALLFAVGSDEEIADKMQSIDINMVSALRDAGYDSTLWAKYDIVKRTNEEERVAFGKVRKSRKKVENTIKQKRELYYPEAFRPMLKRLVAFGNTIPQEKVYIHMDNTSYQLGDTIWFSAYTRRTDTGKPSDVSGVLYVELYGQEGYMIERKLIQMHEGHGQGFFALNNLIQYAGFYELRAYTRWQLNWGLFEHKHLNVINGGPSFYSKQQEREYYRDYEKLYSRVFPVYDKPDEDGGYNHNMTLRAMRRLYVPDPKKRELKVTLYPEGGNLVEGQLCRIAFEAAWDDGEWAEGHLFYANDSAKIVNRGRGYFLFTPPKGMEQEVRFVTPGGQTAKAKLPKAEKTGVSVRMEQADSGWTAHLSNTEDLSADSLAISLMHEGRVIDIRDFSRLCTFPDTLLYEPGVYQMTVFDTQGHIFADRLFFSRGQIELEPTLQIEGLQDEYRPYEPVSLKLKTFEGKNKVSLTVRDDSRRDYLYDDSNILTEMLLSSEIRGFVPQPGWYFEADDPLHRTALDLLMMTQGWRRFDWRNMAIRGLWDLTQPAERTPMLIGSTYKNILASDMAKDDEEIRQERNAEQSSEKSENEPDDQTENGPKVQKPFANKDIIPPTMSLSKNTSCDLTNYKRAISKKEQSNKKELKVHVEMTLLGEKETIFGESETWQRDFRIQLPPFYGKSVFFLSVADTTKWTKKKRKYSWIQAAPDDEENDYMYMASKWKIRRKTFVEPAEYLARIIWPYPRFVKPYNYYQTHLLPVSFEENKTNGKWQKVNDETLMHEVEIRARRSGLRKFDDTWPIFSMDAYEAQNMEQDYGLDFIRIMVGDYGVGAPRANTAPNVEPTFDTRYGYGLTRRSLMDKEIPADSIYARKYLISGSFSLTSTSSGPQGVSPHGTSFGLSPGESLEYKGNGVWDMYVFYSDYSPRMEGSKLYYGANEPKTTLVMYPFPDGSRQLTYRDRRYVLDGFAYPAAFYSPDYSKQIPSEEQKDYRRTLYWNPDLKLDRSGEATITFYNNSRTSHLSVEAEGQASDGTLLWNKTKN